ncbi:hypothetical protein E9536_40330 [Burkholderia sp. LS-044]|nr:hypothetical protein E9536_40330 [Burkholderia sp. LS-044]
MQSERIGLQQRWQVSASTLRTASGYPGQTPISDHQPPTRPGDKTPGSWLRLGARIMPGLAGHSPDYRGVKIVTGAYSERCTWRLVCRASSVGPTDLRERHRHEIIQTSQAGTKWVYRIAQWQIPQ